jgi:hypothetical protein
MKSLSLNGLSVVCLGALSVSAQADLLRSIPESVHLHIAPERGWAGSVSTIPATASFAGFGAEDVNRWLTLANGPQFMNLLGGYSAAFTGKLNPDKCLVSDVPVPMALKAWDEKLDFFKLQTRQLNSCVQFRVRDSAGIVPAEVHPACEVQPIDKYEVVAKGGLCYFKINPNSNFTVRYEVNPECTDINNFGRLELAPLDIFAYSGFYISGDASGRSTLLKPLGSGALRFSVEASEQQTPLSIDMGEGSPRWPVQAYPDVHMGAFDIQSKGTESKLLTRLFFRNSCTGEDDIPCRYAAPIGVQYTIKELLPDGRERMLDQWYAGGISMAAWEGFFQAQRDVTNYQFNEGARYRLEADLTYLSIYHRLFRDGFKNFLIQRGMWTIDPNAPLLPLRPIARMPALDSMKSGGMLPVVSPLAPGGDNNLQLELNQMRALLTGLDWPPYYSEMCGTTACANANGGEARLKVGVDFTLQSVEDGIGKTGEYRIWRDSAFSSEYDLNSPSLIKAVCQ